MHARHLCRLCYNRDWKLRTAHNRVGMRAPKEAAEQLAAGMPPNTATLELKLLKEAYKNAVTTEARVRLRRQIEKIEGKQ